MLASFIRSSPRSSTCASPVHVSRAPVRCYGAPSPTNNIKAPRSGSAAPHGVHVMSMRQCNAALARTLSGHALGVMAQSAPPNMARYLFASSTACVRTNSTASSPVNAPQPVTMVPSLVTPATVATQLSSGGVGVAAAINVDAGLVLTPSEALVQTARNALYKSDRTPDAMFAAAFLGGAYLGFGCMLSIFVGGGSPALMAANPGLGTLLSACVFPIGLTIITFTGADLYTGNALNSALTFLMHPERGVTTNTQKLLRLWSISLLGNLVGSVAMAAAATATVVATGPFAAYASLLAVKKCSLGFGTAFVRGILANWLVNIAVYMGNAARTAGGRVLCVWLPIATFVALGLEHSIANMWLLPFAMMTGAPITAWQIAFDNLLPVVLGNTVGGAICVGVFNWFLSGRKPKDMKHK